MFWIGASLSCYVTIIVTFRTIILCTPAFRIKNDMVWCHFVFHIEDKFTATYALMTTIVLSVNRQYLWQQNLHSYYIYIIVNISYLIDNKCCWLCVVTQTFSVFTIDRTCVWSVNPNLEHAYWLIKYSEDSLGFTGFLFSKHAFETIDI